MTARSVFEAAVAAVKPVQAASQQANALTAQETVSVSDCNVQSRAATLVLGNSSVVSAQLAANKARFAADFAAEQTKQASLAAARNTLKATGDVGPT